MAVSDADFSACDMVNLNSFQDYPPLSDCVLKDMFCSTQGADLQQFSAAQFPAEMGSASASVVSHGNVCATASQRDIHPHILLFRAQICVALRGCAWLRAIFATAWH